MPAVPLDNAPVYDSEGFRRNSTAVRSVTVDDTLHPAHNDTSQRSDLTFWNSRTPSVEYRQPSVMGDGLSSISGLSNSASYQAPSNQYAPTQTPMLQAQFQQPQQNQQQTQFTFPPRGRGPR